MLQKFISPHFKWSEALVTDTGLDNSPVSDYHKANLVQTFRTLSRVRQFCGFPLHINSAYRTPEVNKAVGGEDDSYHLSGRAVDIRVIDLSESQLNLLRQSLTMHYPVDYYETETFIHVAF